MKKDSSYEKPKMMANSLKSSNVNTISNDLESEQISTNLIESKNINTDDSKIKMPIMNSTVVDSSEEKKNNVVVTTKDDSNITELDKSIEAIKNEGEKKKKKGKVML